ncbi:MAG: Holliday junction branch migration DNA helicase RuvB [Hyphomicrobiales bacterium]|jgi:holliday junction DNA helicase RuvB|nr:Holliday junction branch migration DNA helicase RuvB [Hyphomicrobiales bacterium]|tara:strand:- start:271 stop:1233 length:963 start_codon:yes stop_codon:yes gene_type:complete
MSQDRRIFRPKLLDQFIGQNLIRKNLKVFIEAARERKTSLDHVLLAGPPGLGKTTLATIIANEIGVNIRITSGPLITKAGDLAAIISNIEENDVLFIDEIHRLNSSVEEVLYAAMEDFVLDILIGEGPAAKSVRLELAPFTLIGATTRLGLISNPLRERFGIPISLDFYKTEDLSNVVKKAADELGILIDDSSAMEIAARSRGTPRIANRLLRRVHDYSIYNKDKGISISQTKNSLKELEVDDIGLNALDYRYLNCIIENYNGGPAGINSIAASMGEAKDVIEDVVEPYLIQKGLVNRTSRGRTVAKKSIEDLKNKMTEK